MTTLIKNADVIQPRGVLRGVNILFDEKIRYIGAESPSGADRVIDAGGLFLAPGFIDIHTHGCGGADTMDGADAVLKMSELAVRGGTTSFLPTTVAASRDSLRNALNGIREAKSKFGGANILGAHIEGPFLSVKYKGAHEEALLTDPDAGYIEDYLDVVKLVTLAPERKGAREFIEYCRKAGIVCSIGHTAATLEQCTAAMDWGASSFTHSYNAMSPLNHREPGTVGALLTSDAFAELICDNIHVHPAAQRVVFGMKGHAKTILITDALRPCMVGDGPFTLGNLRGAVKDGKATLEDGTIAGSVLTMNRAVYNFMNNMGCEPHEAVYCATAAPAAMLGLHSKGRAEEGLDADLTLLTNTFEVETVFVSGVERYGILR